MKKICYFIGLIIVFFNFESCSNEEPQIFSNPKDNHQNADSRFISLSEAVNLANYYIDRLGDSNTRSSTRKVSHIHMLKGSSTRTESSDSKYNDYYLINYENNQGFAIVSTDKWKAPVYAFSDEGALSWSDTTKNEGFRHYVHSLNELNATFIPDSLIIRPNPEDLTNYQVNIYRKVSPLITKVVAHIGQESPFNTFCPIDTLWYHFPAGCGPVSLTTVFSHFSKPVTLNGYSINWYEIRNTEKSPVTAHVLAELGEPNYLNVDYARDGSACTKADLKKTLRLLNYSFSDSQFVESDILNSLENYLPVIIFGKHENPLGNISHIFVSDGYLTTQTIYRPFSINPTYVYKNYLHLLWGNEGNGNGYFLSSDNLGGNAEYYEEGESLAEVIMFKVSSVLHHVKYQNY